MFKFPWNKPRNSFSATDATRKAFGLAPITVDPITTDFEAAAIENAAAGVPPRPDIYKVEKHLKTAADMLAGLEARKDKLEIEGQIEEEEYEKADIARREKFALESREAREAHVASVNERAAEIDEVNRLIRFYSAAETLTAPEVPVIGAPAPDAETKAKAPLRPRRKPAGTAPNPVQNAT